jgi:uncharacterized protein involved in exopolysaccharide biosynthesis
LCTVEPAYVSVAKVWTKERNEDSGLLRILREGEQEETHAKVQTEILFSDRVAVAVIDELGLLVPPPSQSTVSKLFGRGGTRELEVDQERARGYALRALKKSLKVDLLNPEVLKISISMNEPYLSRRVLQSTMRHYQSVYLSMLQTEIEGYERYLGTEVLRLSGEVEQKMALLLEFESAHPELQRELTASVEVEAPVPAALGRDVGDVSSLPLIMSRISELELRRNQLSTVAGKGNHELDRVEKEIAKNLLLKDEYTQRLTGQAKLLVLHQQHEWELESARKRYSKMREAYDEVTVSKGTMLEQSASITVLDAPSLNLVRVAPRKKVILAASLFVGILLGLSAVYLATLFDKSYRRACEVEEETGLPVIGKLRRADLC